MSTPFPRRLRAALARRKDGSVSKSERDREADASISLALEGVGDAGWTDQSFDNIIVALAQVISWGVYYHHFHDSQRLLMLSPG